MGRRGPDVGWRVPRPAGRFVVVVAAGREFSGADAASPALANWRDSAVGSGLPPTAWKMADGEITRIRRRLWNNLGRRAPGAAHGISRTARRLVTFQIAAETFCQGSGRIAFITLKPVTIWELCVEHISMSPVL